MSFEGGKSPSHRRVGRIVERSKVEENSELIYKKGGRRNWGSDVTREKGTNTGKDVREKEGNKRGAVGGGKNSAHSENKNVRQRRWRRMDKKVRERIKKPLIFRKQKVI